MNNKLKIECLERMLKSIESDMNNSAYGYTNGRPSNNIANVFSLILKLNDDLEKYDEVKNELLRLKLSE